jgi:hypothetical protein
MPIPSYLLGASFRIHSCLVLSKTHIYRYQRLSEVAIFVAPPKKRCKT